VDFSEIFASVDRMDGVRFIPSVSVQRGLIWRQFGIKTAFLNGDLDEETCLSPPAGFEVPSGHTLKLRKSLDRL